MSNLVENPYPIFTDANGDPLEDGYIFIGEPGLSPLTNPLQAYWDSLLTIPANDIRTKGGYPANSGTPGRLYTDGNYSIVVQDRRGSTVYTKDNALDYSNATGSGVLSSVDSVVELREIVPGEPYVQISLAGLNAAGDGLMGPIYYWDPASLATDNGTSIIKPTTVTAAGRWLWGNTLAPTDTVEVFFTGTLDLAFTNRIFLVANTTPVILTVPSGDFQGQLAYISNDGTSTIEIEGPGITAGTLIGEGSTLTWIGVRWLVVSIGGSIRVDTVTANTVNTTVLNTATMAASGAITAATLNTGQGANELYDMNQNVLTNSAVQFGSLSTGDGALKFKYLTGTLAASALTVDIAHGGLTASSVVAVTAFKRILNAVPNFPNTPAFISMSGTVFRVDFSNDSPIGTSLSVGLMVWYL